MLLVAVGLYVAAMAFRVYVRKYYLFLPDYVRWTLTSPAGSHAGPTHVLLLFVDHFEPDSDPVRTRRWAERYVALAARHHDSDGRPPQHTWFYPGEQYAPRVLEELRRLTEAGLGEVELHHHHTHETEETLRAHLNEAIGEFQRFGFLKTVDGQTHFGFIHGNWGLDNSNGPGLCGVNTELRLLHSLGSFADFTFPSLYHDSQPPFVNAIYAARDDDRPKSYDRQLPLATLRDGTADLMIFEGPLVFSPTLSARRLFLALEDGNIHAAVPISAKRVDDWVRANIHVAERPDWVFIKISAHGVSSAADADATLGPDFDAALTHLERQYNDGNRYVLHYVTAREAYNLVRAAVDGAKGEPERYLDWVIPPYLADGRRVSGGGQ
jgi:hypothetical protein